MTPCRRRSGKPRYSRDRSCLCGAAPGSHRSRTRRGQSRAASCQPFSALLVAKDVARYGHALVAGLEEVIQHSVMSGHHFAAAQDAAVARCDGLDIELVEHLADAAPDLVGGC